MKTGAALGSAALFALVPRRLRRRRRALTGWPGGAAPGIARVVAEFVRFVREGAGHRRRWRPRSGSSRGGLYRYVRNPMYLGVATTIVGQALLLARPVLALYAAAFVEVVATFVRFHEQPALVCQSAPSTRTTGARCGRIGVARDIRLLLARHPGHGPDPASGLASAVDPGLRRVPCRKPTSTV